MSRPKNVVVAQSGGPTPVINASLRGWWMAAALIRMPLARCMPAITASRGAERGAAEPVGAAGGRDRAA